MDLGFNMINNIKMALFLSIHIFKNLIFKNHLEFIWWSSKIFLKSFC